MMNHISVHIKVLSIAIIAAYVIGCSAHNYGAGFYNHTGCMYAYLEGGMFKMTLYDGSVVHQKLDIDSLTYDAARTKCTKDNQPGRIVFSFKVDEKSGLESIAIAMRIVPSISEGYWEISKANLTVSRADVEKKRTFPLRVNNLEAGTDYSFSCNELRLQTLHRKKLDNETSRVSGSITLHRFQLQPFPELENVVFASSFDCSTWISLPGLMGFILISFITVVTIIGVRLLKSIETNDFKNNKEGQLFTQSQLESQKRQ